MMKKLTISVSEEVYEGLYAKIGAGRISRFIDNLARPHVVDQDIEDGYKAMSQDDARELQANEWTSGLINEAW
ncbi:MAG: addiction module antitoxin [Alphaproteobacteria bacterium]|nr:addiction module antitoxin [Alphaproteobacteria bacterium]